MDEATKFMFFSSYYEAAKLLPENEQGAFLMGLLAYAFDDEEPSFEGAAKVAFVLVKPNIDASVKRSKINTANAKSERKANAKATAKANCSEEKATAEATPSLEKEKEKERSMEQERDKEKERARNFSLEKNFSTLSSSGGAAAAKAAPPRCPLCETKLAKNTQTGKWDCPGCCETYPPDRFAA